jgi:2-methylcitrate dehydratase PrpD
MTASEVLANFCVNLKLESIPDSVKQIAKALIIDTVGVSTYGSHFPWSQSILRYAQNTGSGGKSRVFGVPDARLHAASAALCNGAFAHAFEQDSLRKPGAGVHPGATLVAPAFAVAEECGATGAEILLAVIAGCEVMFRIGAASLHTSEKKGFHAPGLTGPYGSAVVTGMLLGLNEKQITAALGIAGSMSAGLLAFTKAQGGADVKRLHLGRAAESGVMAAMLVAQGLAGPENILEGKFGFLESYCADKDATLLTSDLGRIWETEKVCLKAFPCHVTAHTPIESLRELMRLHAFHALDVEAIEIEVSEKVLSHHVIRKPLDIKQAQYSTPFCVAWALFRDPYQPENMNDSALHDPQILKLCQEIVLTPFLSNERKNSAWSTLLRIKLKSGVAYEQWSDEFSGSPRKPLSNEALESRFYQLTGKVSESIKAQWWNAMNDIEHLASLSNLPALNFEH